MLEILSDRFADQDTSALDAKGVLATLDVLEDGGGERCGSLRHTQQEDECGYCSDGDDWVERLMQHHCAAGCPEHAGACGRPKVEQLGGRPPLLVAAQRATTSERRWRRRKAGAQRATAWLRTWRRWRPTATCW